MNLLLDDFEHRSTVSYFISHNKKGVDMVKNKVEIFKNTTEGKNIKSYGTLLVVFGAITGIVSIGYLTYLIAEVISSKSELTNLGILVLLYYVLFIAVSIYYINRGIKIRNFKLSPAQTLLASIVIIILLIVTHLCSALLGNQLAPGVSIGFGLFNLIVFMDSVLYIAKLHKKYVDAYNGKVQPTEEKTVQAKKIKHTNRGNKDIDEYEDDML